MKIKNIFATAATLAAFFTVLVVNNASCCETLPRCITLHTNNTSDCVKIDHNARTVQITGDLLTPTMQQILCYAMRIIENQRLCPENSFDVTVKLVENFRPNDVETKRSLKDVEALQLALVLANFSNLGTLDISENDISDDGALLIAWRLPASVREVNLSGNRITLEEQLRIRNLLQQKSPNCRVVF